MGRRIPTHKGTLILPGGQEMHFAEVHPLHKKPEADRAYCKYCYRTHSNWWLMPPEEYEVNVPGAEDTRALLCGKCEHVSLACFMEFDE